MHFTISILLTGLAAGLIASIPAIIKLKHRAWANILFSTIAGVIGSIIGGFLGFEQHIVLRAIPFLEQNLFSVFGALILAFVTSGFILFFSKDEESRVVGRIVILIVGADILISILYSFLIVPPTTEPSQPIQLIKHETIKDKESEIDNFEDCVNAGNLVNEGPPRQCQAGDKVFTEKIDSKRFFCEPKQREVDFCIEIYEPVCATVKTQHETTSHYILTEQTFSNSCKACQNSLVESYVMGECEEKYDKMEIKE